MRYNIPYIIKYIQKYEQEYNKYRKTKFEAVN